MYRKRRGENPLAMSWLNIFRHVFSLVHQTAKNSRSTRLNTTVKVSRCHGMVNLQLMLAVWRFLWQINYAVSMPLMEQAHVSIESPEELELDTSHCFEIVLQVLTRVGGLQTSRV